MSKTAPPVIRTVLTRWWQKAAGAAVAVLLCGLNHSLADDTQKQLAFFEARIRPVLVANCYECHSTQDGADKGGLRLDSAAALLTGGDSGAALIPGDAADSLIISALHYDGLEMPPAGRLPKNVITDFETWIDAGAIDPRQQSAASTTSASPGMNPEAGRSFWAFQPIRDFQVPSTRHASGNSIDAFIHSKLETANIAAAPLADRNTLVRRLSYDLTGLPPTMDVVRASGASSQEFSMESVVDGFLNSPQFGVLWGRHWLDVARYADSNGGDFNATFHNAWRYRDYVVDSMNNDKPYNQFVREQLAGDLLPFDTDYQRTEQLVATGFLMIGTKMLSERDKDKLQMDVVDEQINTVGSAFLGMTLGCARCHDHKFDPVPTADYYALAGIFRSTRTLEGESQKYVSTWKRTALPTEPSHVSAVNEFAAQKTALEKELKSQKQALAKLEKQVSLASPFLVDDVNSKTTGTWKSSTLSPGFVGKHYVHDDNSDKGAKSIRFPWQPPSPGTFEVRVSYTSNSGRAHNVPVEVQHADGTTKVLLDQTIKPTLDGGFAAIGRFSFESQRPAGVTISNAGTSKHVIADAVHFVEVDGQGNFVKNDDPARGAANEQLRQKQAQVQQLELELKQLAQIAPPPLPEAIAAVDSPDIGDCEICIRGEHTNPGRIVPRAFLQAAKWEGQPTIPPTESGRRQLADWIAHRENPLTARVIVNRVWNHLLGEGLVRSIDNFGQLGERPTHPKLLDHLACRFSTPVGEQTSLGAPGLGWSIKSLIREIVLTETYQRQSVHSETAWQQDPGNRLLWKANRKRLPAESIRDTVLFVSGQLDLSPGGSPVEGLGTLVRNNDANADAYSAEETAHRSLYLPIIRNELPPILTAFDFADPDLVVGKRAVTNVPAQALLLMNSPFIMRGARKTAERILHQTPPSTVDTVTRVYELVVFRAPTPGELARAVEFLQLFESPAPTTKSESADDGTAVTVTQLAGLVQALFASTEFRMLN